MKNRSTTRFLLVAVLAIWGIVGWKIYAAIKEDDKMEVIEQRPPAFSDSGFIIPPDYVLFLDYPDPFLGEVRKPPVNNHVRNNTQHKTDIIPEKNPPPEAAWPLIHYFGLVRSPKNGKTVGFLDINEESRFIRAGDVIENIRIVSLAKDSAVVEMGKERHVYYK